MVELDWLGRWALYSPSRVAIVDKDADTSLTYAEAERRARMLAVYLSRERGIGAGDRVAILRERV